MRGISNPPHPFFAELPADICRGAGVATLFVHAPDRLVVVAKRAGCANARLA